MIVESFGPGEAAVGTVPSEGTAAVVLVRHAFAPLRNVTGAAPPFITVRTPAELPAALHRLVADGAALDALQAANRAWWERAIRYYAGRFARAVCPSDTRL